jgi:pimeloyl-ACP methyl ester carboxylesterase
MAAPGSELPVDDLILQQLTLGFSHLWLPTLFGMAWLVVFTDAELSHLPMPVLLLVGDQEMICDPRASVDRVRRLIPNAEAEIVPGAGHGLCLEQAERVNARLLEFLLSPRQPA